MKCTSGCCVGKQRSKYGSLFIISLLFSTINHESVESNATDGECAMTTVYSRYEELLIVSRFCYIVLLVIALTLSGCAEEVAPVDETEILSRIVVGSERGEAKQALADAWYHSECPYADGRIEDLFLYGPQKRDQVTIISIMSSPEGEKLVVTDVGAYEPYFLDPADAFGECQPPVLDAFEESE